MTSNYENYLRDFFQILLEKASIEIEQQAPDPAVKLAYFDLINIAKEQALFFNIELKKIGLDGIDEWTYLK